jgi:type II secretory pathway pseudopilin PulG
MKAKRRATGSGFTLMEVTVSVGLLVFAILVIMGSLGTAARQAANDARRTLAVELLHRCFRDIDMAQQQGGAARSPLFGLEPVAWGAAPVKVRLWFDADGDRVEQEQDAFFQCDVTASRDAGGLLGHLHGRVVWPARRAKGSPDGEAELFTSMLLP